MRLSLKTLQKISGENVSLPPADILDLPEKVLQFGTGRLLRGLPDYFIDAANRNNIFNGRVVVVKSTSQGDASVFKSQNGLYTLCERGIRNGKNFSTNSINSSISRVLTAHTHWKEILKCAHNKDLQIIISNTTETGIQLVRETIGKNAPESFPGKLLAFLHERFKAFKGRKGSGMVIIPTELIPDNGKTLESIIMEMAFLNSFDEKFMEWLETENAFCNSLVDRIVTGMPAIEEKKEIESALGYRDDLMIVSEPYCLWAIEGDSKVKHILSFAKGAKGMIIEKNIDKYRELKLRLLNGTHTLTCGIAFLTHCSTVADALEDDLLSTYIKEVMKREIAQSIPLKIPVTEVKKFTDDVLERFRNPYIHHLWKNITLQYSTKMHIRCIPLLLNYYETKHQFPRLITLGFAAYLLFMKPAKKSGDSYYGELDGESYLINDTIAGWYYANRKEDKINSAVKDTLQNTSLWGIDLTTLPSFQKEIVRYAESVRKYGMRSTLENVLKTDQQLISQKDK